MKMYHGHPSPASIESAREAAPSMVHGAEWSTLKMTPHDWPYIVDNGAFSAYVNSEPWDATAFVRRLNEMAGRRAKMPRRPDFVVLPDVVADPEATLKRAEPWNWHLNELGLPRALPVQDGHDIESVADTAVDWGCTALFVGGTEDWKRRNAGDIVDAAHDRGLDCHIGRPGDLAWARETGADSIDSTSIVQNGTFEKLAALEEQQTLAPDGGGRRA